MNIFFSICICYLALELVIANDTITYEGYIVFEVFPYDEALAQMLLILERDSDIQILSHGVHGLRRIVNILISPEVKAEFIELLVKNNINFKVIVDNFERYINHEHVRTKRAATLLSPGEINFDGYHRHDVINEYLKNLALKYPSVANLLNIGKTTEGRDILALRITNGGLSKPIILIDAGFHAREWIAPALALYIIQQLVENATNKHLVKNVDWIIVPVMNPDGYEYTHTTDRLWRKTRSKGINCTGTDPNRNFDFHWGEKGSEPNECSSIYHGPKAFSEPETCAYRDLVLKHASYIKLVLSLHSFSQLILYPWGHTWDLPTNVEQLHSLGINVANAIKNVAGTKYAVNSTAHALYYASGTSSDWVMGTVGINLTYVIELTPFNGSPIEFKLPAKYIKEVVSETFQGIKVFHSYIENLEIST